jgi:hypothetical protein
VGRAFFTVAIVTPRGRCGRIRMQTLHPGADADSFYRLSSIESFDLSSAGNNALIHGLANIRDMACFYWLKSSTAAALISPKRPNSLIKSNKPDNPWQSIIP